MSKDKVKWLIVGLVAVVLASKLWQEGTHRFDTVRRARWKYSTTGAKWLPCGTMKNKGRGALVIYNAVGKELPRFLGMRPAAR